MNIADCLVKAFPKATSWARVEDIEANPNLMELRGSVDLIAAVPVYMLWCVHHPDSSELVSDFTLAALAEYGRCKSPENPHLNFRFRCSTEQLEVVVSFLEWSSHAVQFQQAEMIERSLRNWKDAVNKSQPFQWRRSEFKLPGRAE